MDNILKRIGFDHSHSEYHSLKHDIAKGINLEDFIEVLKHKEKL